MHSEQPKLCFSDCYRVSLKHLYLIIFQDYLQLGPLELKLLNVTGQSMPIHVPQPPSEEELEAKTCAPDQWPVTQPMLKELVTPRQVAT